MLYLFIHEVCHSWAPFVTRLCVRLIQLTWFPLAMNVEAWIKLKSNIVYVLDACTIDLLDECTNYLLDACTIYVNLNLSFNKISSRHVC